MSTCRLTAQTAQTSTQQPAARECGSQLSCCHTCRTAWRADQAALPSVMGHAARYMISIDECQCSLEMVANVYGANDLVHEHRPLSLSMQATAASHSASETMSVTPAALGVHTQYPGARTNRRVTRTAMQSACRSCCVPLPRYDTIYHGGHGVNHM